MRRSRARLVIVGLAASSVVLFVIPASVGAAPTPITFTLTSNDLGTGVLPQATVGHPYAVQLADGSPPGTDYYIVSNDLPAGLTATQSGLISGTPEVPQTTQSLAASKNPVTDTVVRDELLDLTVSSGNATLDALLIPLDTSIVAKVLPFIEEQIDELQGELQCLGEVPVRPPCNI